MADNVLMQTFTGNHTVAALIVVLALWEVYWTYRACWLAAQRNEKRWFLFFSCSTYWAYPKLFISGKIKAGVTPKHTFKGLIVTDILHPISAVRLPLAIAVKEVGTGLLSQASH